ncbi:putative transcription regulator A20-like family [Helianthus anomalus]
MEKNDTGSQATLEAPILCVSNCGFFGTSATMNMCSKCHKDMILKQEEAKLTASSIESIVNGQNIDKTSAVPNSAGSEVALSTQPSSAPQVQAESNEKPNEGQSQGPSRCTTCRKRVGLTGFSCRCGHVFYFVHRYSDKHVCQFDFRATAKDTIAKANPMVKAECLKRKKKTS